MPSSPLEGVTNEVANDPNSAFRQGLSETDQLIDQGISLSGHERNCAFLNVAGQRFATASAVLGLDFDDDARSPALVDWDRDGDLDVWIANRTAPMLRFLRNELAAQGGAATALRLQGRKANRDAIGSRVELRLRNGRTLVRTLKAGEGYLAQSSKWLHFGFSGEAARTEIESVRVRWPGGEVEIFAGVEPGNRYRLLQGSGRAVLDRAFAAAEGPAARGSVRPFEKLEDLGTMAALSVAEWPLPRLPYTTFSGEKAWVGGKGPSGQRTLVNLWATWCLPCQKELVEFEAHAEALRKAGVGVFALSVDGLSLGGNSVAASAVSPESFYKRLGVSFPAGRASEPLVQRLENAYAHLFGPRWPLPVPTSVLLDDEGRLLAFYKGAVAVERILRDARLAEEAWETRHDAALPFDGQWFRRPQPTDPLIIGLDLMEAGEVDDAMELAIRTPEYYREKSPEYGQFLTWIGDGLMKQERPTEALKFYRSALQEDSDNTIVLNNLAWQLAAHPDASVRDGKEAVRWAARAAQITEQNDPAILDTLAAAFAESGDFTRAVAAAERAAALARSRGNRALWEGIQKSLARYRAGRPFVDGP